MRRSMEQLQHAMALIKWHQRDGEVEGVGHQPIELRPIDGVAEQMPHQP